MPIHRYKSKIWQQLLIMLLLAAFLCSSLLAVPSTVAAAQKELLNDRSADIIGSTPLLVPGILTPRGLSGRGQIVGLADSGLDKGQIGDLHPDLQSEPGTMPRVAMLRSYAGRPLADDPTGHGTHMAGIIAGSGQASQGKYRGMAPGATLYVQGLLDGNGRVSPPANLHELFQPAYEAGVRIHVNGWGGGSNQYSWNSAQIDRYVWSHPDFLPLFGAGNSGARTGTLTTEANSKNVLTIGSSQVPRPAYGPDARSAGEAASTSSRGPAGDGRIKPELLAPGSAVLSTCSSLTESNFRANPAYTRMGGSSMATAVSGGALALTREYLKNYSQHSNPSSALMKALLVNGARNSQQPSSSEGFGILDLAGTLFSVQEKQFQLVDEKDPLQASQRREYSYTVKAGQGPMKATLAWVDPPAAIGAGRALVNNLDLEVQAPDGTLYRGNHFLALQGPDSSNNIEQVCLPAPQPGTYKIRVKAAALNASYPQQTFALVYGQKLEGQTIQGVNQQQLTLEDGSQVELPGNTKAVIDRNSGSASLAALPGASLYKGEQQSYIFSRRWHTGGIQVLQTDSGQPYLVLEMNPAYRDGGYYIHEGPVPVTINGRPAQSIEEIPVGAELIASIHPFAQTLWQLEAISQEIQGVIQSVDLDQQQLTLINQNQPYQLAPWTAMSYVDEVLDCSPADMPYVSAEPHALDKLVAGTPVTMQINPASRQVHHIVAQRHKIVGQVEALDLEQQTIRLNTGHSYSLFPGATLTRDRQNVRLQDLQPGDHILGMVIPEGKKLIAVEAYSSIHYGSVVYYSPSAREVCLLDQNNRLSTFKVDAETEIFKWGTVLEPTSLKPGMWVRLVEKPQQQYAWRIDVAQEREEEVKTFSRLDREKRALIMSDGSVYPYTSATRISRNGYSIDVSDLYPGERLRLTMLEAAASPWTAVLGAVEVEAAAGTVQPRLNMTARVFNTVLIIQGQTNASYLYLYRENGERIRIEPDQNGTISHLLPARAGERYLRVLAFASSGPAVTELDLTISSYPVSEPATEFSDIQGHPAQVAIMDLAQRGVISGCGDGTFQPDRLVTRVEFACMLAKLKKLDIDYIDHGAIRPYTDQGTIPWWGLEAVLAVTQQGWFSGDDQRRFKPLRNITAAEALSVIHRIYGQKPVNSSVELPYPDASQIPFWAWDAYIYCYQHQLLDPVLRSGQLQPLRPLTRGDVALLLHKL